MTMCVCALARPICLRVRVLVCLRTASITRPELQHLRTCGRCCLCCSLAPWGSAVAGWAARAASCQMNAAAAAAADRTVDGSAAGAQRGRGVVGLRGSSGASNTAVSGGEGWARLACRGASAQAAALHTTNTCARTHTHTRTHTCSCKHTYTRVGAPEVVWWEGPDEEGCCCSCSGCSVGAGAAAAPLPGGARVARRVGCWAPDCCCTERFSAGTTGVAAMGSSLRPRGALPPELVAGPAPRRQARPGVPTCVCVCVCMQV